MARFYHLPPLPRLDLFSTTAQVLTLLTNPDLYTDKKESHKSKTVAAVYRQQMDVEKMEKEFAAEQAHKAQEIIAKLKDEGQKRDAEVDEAFKMIPEEEQVGVFSAGEAYSAQI